MPWVIIYISPNWTVSKCWETKNLIYGEEKQTSSISTNENQQHASLAFRESNINKWIFIFTICFESIFFIYYHYYSIKFISRAWFMNLMNRLEFISLIPLEKLQTKINENEFVSRRRVLFCSHAVFTNVPINECFFWHLKFEFWIWETSTRGNKAQERKCRLIC